LTPTGVARLKKAGFLAWGLSLRRNLPESKSTEPRPCTRTRLVSSASGVTTTSSPPPAFATRRICCGSSYGAEGPRLRRRRLPGRQPHTPSLGRSPRGRILRDGIAITQLRQLCWKCHRSITDCNRSGEGRFCLHDISLVLDKPRRNHITTPERNTRSNQEHTNSDDEANEPTLSLPGAVTHAPSAPTVVSGHNLAGGRGRSNQAFPLLREAAGFVVLGRRVSTPSLSRCSSKP